MELKPIKKIKTSCPFPMLEYKVDVLYNEVRKAFRAATSYAKDVAIPTSKHSQCEI